MLVAERIRTQLAAAADPALATAMQAYMKSSLPFLGVRRPQVRQLVRATEAALPLTEELLRAEVTSLWDEAQYREHRYAAADLLNTERARAAVPADRLQLLQRLIVAGAWWDHVDDLSRRVGEVLSAHPAETRPRLLEWAVSDDIWLRRSSMICQLGFGDRTDLELLSSAVEASASEKNFFLRKGIGWALRDYARTDPAWVRAFVDAHQLSPLSVREALKHL